MDNNSNKEFENRMGKNGNRAAFSFEELDTDQKSSSYQNNQKSQADADEMTHEVTQASELQAEPEEKKRKKNPLKEFGLVCMAIFIVGCFFVPIATVDESDAARKALADKVSTTLSAGTILLSKDEDIGQQDYTITHTYDKSETKIWVWDYASEDGDYVQILVNGAPLSDVFMIKHRTTVFTVPAESEIQIKGIRDGGGGITYAVRYELNNTTYFNSAPEGESNTYTLIKE